MIIRVFLTVCFLSIVERNVTGQTLVPGGLNVCSETFKSSYYTRRTYTRTGYNTHRSTCGFLWLSRCKRSRSHTVYYTNSVLLYRTSTKYKCCNGWARQGTSCPLPICNPSCQNGACVNPDTCQCHSGYTGNRCQYDIDECLNKPCDQECTNLAGTYSCSCRRGYEKMNKADPKSRQCVDVDECKTTPCKCAENTPGCTATCSNTIGSFTCSCNRGFKLLSNICIDINECSSNTMNTCQQNCHNTIGSYYCSCNKGFRIRADKMTCRDVNECATLDGGCSQLCINSIGSFRCDCRKGYRLGNDGKSCLDINECTEQKPCDNTNGICTNTPGSYRCTCKIGHKLLPDKKTCNDTDECKETKPCQHFCENTVGSFVCSCRVGYRLSADKRRCNDINECSEGTTICDQLCHNTVGSFHCACRAGYQIKSDDQTCKALPCENISPPVDGNISCSGYVTDKNCNFTCTNGFRLIGPGNRTCLSSSHWSGSEPVCKRKECPPVEPPQNGAVLLPCFEEFGVTCLFKCSRGYHMQGSPFTQCIMVNDIATWKESNASCSAETQCSPNPCLHGGVCKITSKTTFHCDCTYTMFKGERCQIGLVNVPPFFGTVVGVPSHPFTFTARPDNKLTISIISSPPKGLFFEPSTLTIKHPNTEAVLRITASKKGSFQISFNLNGPDAKNFETPPSLFLHVKRDKVSSLLINYTTNAFKDGCFLLNVRQDMENLKLLSSCTWKSDQSTNGIVSVSGANYTLPISFAGLTASTMENFKMNGILKPNAEVKDYVEKQKLNLCDINKNCSNISFSREQLLDYIVRFNKFQVSYLNEISNNFPFWFQLEWHSKASSFQDQNMYSQVVSGSILKDLTNECVNSWNNSQLLGSFEIDKSKIYSLYKSNFPLKFNIMGSTLSFNGNVMYCVIIKIDDDSIFLSTKKRLNLLPLISTSVKNIKRFTASQMFFTNNKTMFQGELSLNSASSDRFIQVEGLIEFNDNFMKEKFTGSNHIGIEGSVEYKFTMHFLGRKLSFRGRSNFGTTASLDIKGTGSILQFSSNKNIIDYDFSTIQFKPTSKAFYTVPIITSGGKLSGIENLSLVKYRLRSLERMYHYMKSLITMITDKYVKNVLQEKYQTLKITVQKLKEIIEDPAIKYEGVVQHKNNLRKSFEELNSILSAINEEYSRNSSLSSVASLAIRTQRGLQRTFEQFSAILLPKMTSLKLLDSLNLFINFHGELCVFRLCFPHLNVSIADYVNNDFIEINGVFQNQHNFSKRLMVQSGSTLHFKVQKHTEIFSGRFSATINLFDKLQPINISLNERQYSYSVKSILGKNMKFLVSSSGILLRASWKDIVSKIKGETNDNQKFNERLQNIFSDIAETTQRRLDSAFKRKENMTLMLQKTMTLNEDYKKKQQEKLLAFQRKDAEYRKKYTQLSTEEIRYRSYLQNNASLLLIEKDLDRVCRLKKCKDICLAMPVCDVCQTPVKVSVQYMECKQTIEKIRTSEMMPITQQCQETKYFFIPHYTGNCEEDPAIRGYREQQTKEYMSTVVRGASIGKMIGSIFGPKGSVIGAIVGGIIGAIVGLFSSCDESYEVETKTIIQTFPCQNYTMQVRTIERPISKCIEQSKDVKGGFSEPKQCNCRIEDCFSKTTDAQCILQNQQCQKERDIRLQNTKNNSKLYEYFSTPYAIVKELEEEVAVLRTEVEIARQESNFITQKLNKTIDRLRIVKRESEDADRTFNNVNNMLKMESCLLNHYNKRKTISSFLNIINFQIDGRLPFIENIKIISKVRTGKDSKILYIPFIFTMKDPEVSLMMASEKILRSSLCSYNLREKRSLSEDVKSEVDDLQFTTWFQSENASSMQHACMTFKTVTQLFKSSLQDLAELTENAIKVIEIANETHSRIETQRNDSVSNNTVIKDQEKLVSILLTEITEYKVTSTISHVLAKWKETSEIFTSENNYTVCLGFQDCVETGFKSLKALPTLVPQKRSLYNQSLHELEVMMNRILSDNFKRLESLQLFAKELIRRLNYLTSESDFCAKPPKILKSNEDDNRNITSGTKVTLKCGQYQSDLPVFYQWKLHDDFIDGENSKTITFMADFKSQGVYTCVIISPVGRSSFAGIVLNVYEPPHFLSQPQHIHVLSNIPLNDSSFACNVTGFPTPKISWFYMDYENMTSVDLNVSAPMLTISDIVSNEEEQRNGFYFCRVQNEYGEQESGMARLDRVQIKYPKQFAKISADLNITFGNLSNSTYGSHNERLNETQINNETLSGFHSNNSGLNETKIEKTTDAYRKKYLGEIEDLLLKHISKHTKPLGDSIKLSIDLIEEDGLTKFSAWIDSRSEVIVNNSSMKYLQTQVASVRQKIAGAAATILQMLLRNISRIGLKDDVDIQVIDSSMNYEAKLNICQPGHQLHKGGYLCVQCAAGSFSKDGRQCKLCAIGEYQHTEGATECLKCKGRTNNIGSVGMHQCLQAKEAVIVKEQPWKMIIGIVAGCSIMAIIFIFIFVYRQRKSNPAELKKASITSSGADQIKETSFEMKGASQNIYEDQEKDNDSENVNEITTEDVVENKASTVSTESNQNKQSVFEMKGAFQNVYADQEENDIYENLNRTTTEDVVLERIGNRYGNAISELGNSR